MSLRGTLRRCFVWLLCLCLCLGLAVPALAEDATGAEIRLLKTEGTVTVSSTSGKTYSTREDMRLYNGYVVSTEEASYAWITLDSEKAVKLDQSSSLEVRRSGKTLELLLKSGELFFNVTAPLKEDEKLNIRTSTMVTGVRGTAGWVRQVEEGVSLVGILEGQVVCRVANPFTGASRTLIVKAGQVGEFRVYEADSEGEGADARLLGIGSVEEISGYILEEILKDSDLRKKIEDATGLDFSGVTDEFVAEKIAAEEEENRKKLEEIEANKLTEVISKDPLWEGDQGGGGSDVYTITWNIMGRLETTACKAGEVPYHAVPEYEGYVFVGWSPAQTEATEDTTYTAIFTTSGGEPVEIEQYTVTWIIDGVSSESVYAAGVRPTHDTPTKSGYRFVGWDPDITVVTGDAEYTAIFEEIQQPEETYTITWVDDEGNELGTTQVTAGAIPEYEAPEKEGYEFIGWDPEPAEATENTTYTAMYEELGAVRYTITWLDDEGNTLAEDQVTEGRIPEFSGEVPEKDGYEFVGWDPEPVEATADTSYTAIYDLVQEEVYTITWRDDQGNVLAEDDVAAGTIPEFSGEVPEKAGYEFVGWDPEPAEATADVEYTAIFDPLRFTITWMDDEGNELETSEVNYGETPEYPDGEPEKEGYEFMGWEPEPEAATADAEYTAIFDPLRFNVTWLDDEGNELAAGEVTYGETPEYPGDEPEKEGHEFIGWDPEPAEATTDAEYTAVFEPIEYTITWLDGDGNTLLEEQVPYGETPEYPGDEPTKEEDDEYRYTFNGTWDPEISAVTDEATYTAQFDRTPIYAITVIDPDNSPTMEADKETAAEGETVTVTVTADGYDIEGVYVLFTTDEGEDEIEAEGENGVYTFEMPAAAVTVEASLVTQTFNIYTENPTGFDTIVDAVIDNDPISEASTDDEVTVRVSWDNEVSVLDSVTVSWGDDETLILTEPGAVNDDDNGRTTYYYSFTMPAADVTITANVSALYEIEIDEMMLSNAMVSVNGSDPETYDIYFKSKAGEEVTVVITPNEGSAIAAGSKPSVTYTVDNTVTAVDVSGDNGSYTFTMPENPVRVRMPSVRVETVSGEADTLTISANGTVVSVSRDEALLVSAGTEVTVHAITNDYYIWGCDSSYDNLEITHVDNDRQDETYSFIMPDDAEEIWLYIEIHGE